LAVKNQICVTAGNCGKSSLLPGKPGKWEFSVFDQFNPEGACFSSAVYQVGAGG